VQSSQRQPSLYLRLVPCRTAMVAFKEVAVERNSRSCAARKRCDSVTFNLVGEKLEEPQARPARRPLRFGAPHRGCREVAGEPPGRWAGDSPARLMAATGQAIEGVPGPA
jgi:hypothetical protein